MVEGEAAAPLICLKAQLSTLVPLGDTLVEVDPQTVLYDLHIIFTRLFQSQPQAGAASAKTPDVNAKPDRLRFPLQAPADLLGRRGRYRNHLWHLHVELTYTPYGTILPRPRRSVKMRGSRRNHPEQEKPAS